MESQPSATVADGGGGEDLATLKVMRQQLEERIEARRVAQEDLISSIQPLVPDLVSSLDIFLRLIAAVNRRPFVPTTSPNPVPVPTSRPPLDAGSANPRRRLHPEPHSPFPRTRAKRSADEGQLSQRFRGERSSLYGEGGAGDRLALVRTMVAVCLLERVPFTAIDSAAVLRKLEGDQSSASPAEKEALNELGGEDGAISAVERALRCMAEANGGVDLEEFVVSGKARLMVMGIDRSRLLKELPETAQLNQPTSEPAPADGNMPNHSGGMPGVDASTGALMPRPPHPEMWLGPVDPHLSGLPPIFPGAGGPGSMLGPRGGPRGVMGLMGMPRGMGVPPLHRPPLAPPPGMGGPSLLPQKSTEEDDLKDLEALLSKKSFMELQKSKTGEELLDLIHRPTAKETAVAAKVWKPFVNLCKN